MALHCTLMQKIIVSTKSENIFIYVNTVSNNLNFALFRSFLVSNFID